MAEVALALFAAVGTAASSVGTAAATIGTTVGAGIAGLAEAGSSALGILQGVATAASVASTLVGGVGMAAEAETNAKLASLQGNADALASQQKVLDIQRSLAQKTGEARVAFAASGLDISSASAIEDDLSSQATYQTSIEKDNAQVNKAMAQMRATQYRTSGTVDMIGAAAKALGQAGGYGLDIAKRG